MGKFDAGVTMHIDENTTHEDREALRDALLNLNGVMAAVYHDERPHLMIVVYDPERIKSIEFVNTAKSRGLHAELVA
jgi:hypothetical protein